MNVDTNAEPQGRANCTCMPRCIGVNMGPVTPDPLSVAERHELVCRNVWDYLCIRQLFKIDLHRFVFNTFKHPPIASPAMLESEARIGYDLALFVPYAFLVLLRLWVNSRNRSSNPKLTWLLSDAFVVLALLMAACVIALDVWILAERIRLRKYPLDDAGANLAAVRKLQVDFYKV